MEYEVVEVEPVENGYAIRGWTDEAYQEVGQEPELNVQAEEVMLETSMLHCETEFTLVAQTHNIEIQSYDTLEAAEQNVTYIDQNTILHAVRGGLE